MSQEIVGPFSRVFRLPAQATFLVVHDQAHGTDSTKLMEVLYYASRRDSGIPRRINDRIWTQFAWPIQKHESPKVFIEHSPVLICTHSYICVYITGTFGQGLQLWSQVSGDRTIADVIWVVAPRQDDGGKGGDDQGRTLHLVVAP